MTKANGQKSHNNVLLICEDGIAHEGFTRLFDVNEFPVKIISSGLEAMDLSQYGAIVHLAHSVDSLSDLLGDRLASIQDEEWVLISGEDETDLHCTVELTVYASKTLREFIRTLWSQFSMT